MGDMAQREFELSLLDEARRKLEEAQHYHRMAAQTRRTNMAVQHSVESMVRVDGPCVITVNRDEKAVYKNSVDSKIVDLLANIDLATDYERRFIIDIAKWHRAPNGMSGRQNNFLDDLHRRYVP